MTTLLPHRPPWIELALVSALVTVVLSTLVNVFVTPAWIISATSPLVGAAFADNDKVRVVVVWLSVAVTVALHRRGVSRVGHRVITAGAFLALGLVVVAATWKDPEYNGLWVGFGFAPLVVGLVSAIILALVAVTSSSDQRLLLPLSTTVVGVNAIIPLI